MGHQVDLRAALGDLNCTLANCVDHAPIRRLPLLRPGRLSPGPSVRCLGPPLPPAAFSGRLQASLGVSGRLRTVPGSSGRLWTLRCGTVRCNSAGKVSRDDRPGMRTAVAPGMQYARSCCDGAAPVSRWCRDGVALVSLSSVQWVAPSHERPDRESNKAPGVELCKRRCEDSSEDKWTCVPVQSRKASVGPIDKRADGWNPAVIQRDSKQNAVDKPKTVSIQC